MTAASARGLNYPSHPIKVDNIPLPSGTLDATIPPPLATCFYSTINGDKNSPTLVAIPTLFQILPSTNIPPTGMSIDNLGSNPNYGQEVQTWVEAANWLHIHAEGKSLYTKIA